MVEHDHPQWLELHRFTPRSQEISREKPGERGDSWMSPPSCLFETDDPRTGVKIQNELQLSEAMTSD